METQKFRRNRKLHEELRFETQMHVVLNNCSQKYIIFKTILKIIYFELSITRMNVYRTPLKPLQIWNLIGFAAFYVDNEATPWRIHYRYNETLGEGQTTEFSLKFNWSFFRIDSGLTKKNQNVHFAISLNRSGIEPRIILLNTRAFAGLAI